MPKMAIFNAIYGGNVGHASITIVDLQNEEKPIYISHRPRINITHISEVERDDSILYVLKGYAPKAEPISFKQDCELRKRKPDIEMHIPGWYLNISRMILYSEKYLQNELPKSECLYHIAKNNCCAVVVNFIRQGLNCPNIKKTCGICDRGKNQKGTTTMNWLLRIIMIVSYVMGLSVTLRIIVRNLEDTGLQTGRIPIILSVISASLMFFWLFGWFSNIERGIIGLIPCLNIWSPITLQIFVKRINKIIDKKKHKFRCPRTRKGIFYYLNKVFDYLMKGILYYLKFLII
ncbi:MAG: hypothetical protein F6K38_36530 [Moorea sp. SIO3B2]|nr:hypothetical protein [Moorena sp. SIO3B2]